MYEYNDLYNIYVFIPVGNDIFLYIPAIASIQTFVSSWNDFFVVFSLPIKNALYEHEEYIYI